MLGTLVLKAALHNQEYGYASTIGLSMAFFDGIIIAIFTFLRRRGWEI